ncbi:MAG: T9SS type A sorting domain-containing protein [Candidatus Zixiibacteriota bacterium]
MRSNRNSKSKRLGRQWYQYLLLVSFLLAGNGLTAIIRVPADAVSIQSGITLAADGDTVLVSADIYSGTGNSGIRFWGKRIVVKSESGPGATIIQATDTTRLILFDQGEDSFAILDGFTISGVYETVEDWLDPFSGGIVIDSASPVIRNCIIRNSYRDEGGGVYIASGSPLFENCTIINNQAVVRGGGIFNGAGSVRMISCTIENNRVYGPIDFWLAYGGGIYNSGDISLTDSRISGNRVDHVSFEPSSTDYALAQGGGIYSLAGRLHIDSCIVSHNSSGVAGGILAGLESVELLRSVFFNNTADIYAAVVFMSPGSGIIGELTADHCTFACNYSAQISSDGIAIVNNPTESGIEFHIPDIFAASDHDIAEGTARIANSIFVFNGSAPILTEIDQSVVTIGFNDFWHTVSGPHFNGIADKVGVDGNISADPFFCMVSDSGLGPDSLSPVVTADEFGGIIGAKDVGCRNINDIGVSLYTAVLNGGDAGENQTILDSVIQLLSPWDTLVLASDSPRAEINYLQIDFPLYVVGPGTAAPDTFVLSEAEYPAKRAVVYIRDFCVIDGLVIEAFEPSGVLVGYNAVNCAESPAIVSNCDLWSPESDAAFANFDGTPLVRTCDLISGLSVFGAQDIVASYNYWDCVDNACIDSKIQFDSLFFTGRVRYSPFLDDIPTDVDNESSVVMPSLLSVEQNAPNPFNPTTTIRFSLRRSAQVRVDILNILGQKITELYDGQLPVGAHSLIWDGAGYPSGIYLYRIAADADVTTKEMILLK